jgi:transcription elongation factor Elf1
MSSYKAYTRYRCLECGQEHSFRITIQERVTTYFHGPNIDAKSGGKPFYICEEVDRGHGGETITNVECSVCGGEVMEMIEID